MNISVHKTKHKTLKPTWMSDKLLKLIVSENRALKRTGSSRVGVVGGIYRDKAAIEMEDLKGKMESE